LDLLLDVNTHDAIWTNAPLDESGVTSPFTQTIAQRLKIRLLTYQNEWFYDTTYGIPYFQSILAKKTTKANVDLIFQQAILSEPGVKQIVTFTSTLINRQYSLTFSVKVVDGTVTQPITITPV
jgi:hypothetical protein